jgi:prolyl oligopeptidase
MRSLPAVLLLCACGTAGTLPQPAPPAPPSAAPSAPAAKPPADPELAELDALNRRALAGAVTDDVHGLKVPDPFRALEADTELTRGWIAAQTARTERALAAGRDPQMEQRLTELLAIGSLDDAAIAGERMFVMRREGTREQAALYALEPKGSMPEAPLVDPLTFSPRAAIDWSYPSPDGRRVAFGLSNAGDERSELRVIDVASKTLLPDRIAHAKWSYVSWLPDGSGFYYTRYPKPGEPGHDPAQEDGYFPRVFVHALGADPERDALVWQSQTGSDVPMATAGSDGRYVTVTNHRGFAASDVYLLDRGKSEHGRVSVPDARHAFTAVVKGRDKRTAGQTHRGMLYLLTDIDAPRRRIVRVAPEQAADLAAWRDVVPETIGTVEDFALLRDAIVVHYAQDIRSRLWLFDLDGKNPREVALPASGSIESLAADPDSDTFAFVFSSYFYPPALFRYDARTRSLALVHQVAHDLDLSRYTLQQAPVRSADGTEVNLTYVHEVGIPRDGQRRVLLYGYGGFDVSLLPHFTRSALYFIERGGIYAVANLRGGGELGEAWHRGGMLANKPRVFEDFEAAIRWFSDSGISNPERIAITGGSNGGLLCGALLTRAPGTFRAAASYVGLYDMLRYHLFPPAQLWTSELGDPNDAEAARYLLGYSPYQNVHDGTHYPAVLIETAENDTRVFWGHSTKFAARLQTAQAATHPIYFYMEREQGHGRGAQLHDLVKRYARMYAFLDQELGRSP